MLLKQIADHARTSGNEVCGLLFGDGDHVTAASPCVNVAVDPARTFEIDPAALVAAHRRARTGGARPIGHYHSHPGGSSTPSPRDAADAVADGALWLIVGGQGVHAWRAVADGAVEGRFDPVPLVIGA